ncbi:DEAD/DEAH box helicase [Acidithiobacillus ferrivorans]|nr:DEAD/DEAH box helicase [Acidithiobacillus ferrivorans]
MTTTIHDILDGFRTQSTDTFGMGRRFERLMAQFLVTDAVHKQEFEHVWLWNEWPAREEETKKYQFSAKDPGIDLVGKHRDGTYCAIQCKMYENAKHLNAESFANFILSAASDLFEDGLIIATGGELTKNLMDRLDNAHIRMLFIEDLENSNVDWSQWSPNENILRVLPKKHLRDHQVSALHAVRGFDDAGKTMSYVDDLDNSKKIESSGGLRDANRGKLIMACGTGKTLTGLRIAEDLVPLGGHVLFAVPSLTLLSQTLREWANEAILPMRFFAVCSDSGVSREEEDIRMVEVPIAPTTVAGKLVKGVQAPFGGITVILSTYHSMDVIREAQEAGMPTFDLVLCDEAHRTTGVQLSEKAKASVISRAKKKAEAAGETYNPRSQADESSAFLMVHDNELIRAKKRLYMTATPRIYGEETNKKAAQNAAAVYSMDNEAWFGKTLHTLKFGDAITSGILTDFKVIIVAMRQESMAGIANTLSLENGKAIDSLFAAKVVGAWKALSKSGILMTAGSSAFAEGEAPMRSGVAFSHTIKSSQELKEGFQLVVNAYLQEQEPDESGAAPMTCEFHHVDGGMSANHRRAELDWLAESTSLATGCRVLTNARCLSEGVDVPTLDAVLFFDARDSMVDVVQSVGRVMRRSDATGKEFGYIILPVGIPSDQINDLDAFISKDLQFKNIWKVLKALRAHDNRLVDNSEYRRRVTVITGDERSGKKSSGTNGDQQGELEFPPIPIDKLSESVYAVIPDKLGDREYWSDWSRDVADVANSMRDRLVSLLQTNIDAQDAFDHFLDEIRQTMNPAVARDDAVDMLVQHIITRPVFEALFPDVSFVQSNPVSRAMERIVDFMDEHGLEGEAAKLESFYTNVEKRIALAKSDKSRQDVIRNLYDTFFMAAFPKLADKLGIVYTPVEMVDFIIHSANAALQEEFGVSLGDRGVDILDPFTGTGTFITRLIQSGLISSEQLQYKFQNEIHANEITLLAYYIASLNIESSYEGITKEHLSFDGIVLGDTFMLGEDCQSKQVSLVGYFAENSERAKRQDAKDIRVIIGNPPYSVGQDNANDNNQNLKYDALDASIRATYAAHSTAAYKNSLYDSYMRAFRWASNRIKDQGVICFVTNGGWIDTNAMDGFRKSLADEFTSIYVYNLRGNFRKFDQREGQNVFGQGCGTTVCITLLVKNPQKTGHCEIHYAEMGDGLKTSEKLKEIAENQDITGVAWGIIEPNASHDWINPRSEDFGSFMAMGDKSGEEDKRIFAIYSLGISTNRDAWVYNFSNEQLTHNTWRTISFYNSELERYNATGYGAKPDEFVEYNNKMISWSSTLIPKIGRGLKNTFNKDAIRVTVYRPFVKQITYFDNALVDRMGSWQSLMPTLNHQNLAISVTGLGESKDFSCLMVDSIPNLHLIAGGQCFPLFHYEKAQVHSDQKISLFDEAADSSVDSDGYTRKDAITDNALADYRTNYLDDSIIKEDIFYYVYGVLHSPEYRERYANDLKKMLPRIPFVPEVDGFWAFSKAGRDLAAIHVDYESLEPYAGLEIIISDAGKGLPPYTLYKVDKMRFGRSGKDKDKTVIQYNDHITIQGIPLETYGYMVNGKPAIEWVMDRYKVKTDEDSGITNDPNDWCREHDDWEYIARLIGQVVQVSVDTVRIVGEMPGIGL